MNDLDPVGDNDSRSPAVNRAAAILELLAVEGEALGTSEIARRIDRPKSTVANILSALDQTGLIQRTTGGYALGRKLVELAGSYLSNMDLVAEFQAATNDLPTASAETLLLATLSGTDVVYLARHDGSQPVRLAADIGRRLPAVATALGQAMLASLSEAELAAVLTSVDTYPALTANSYRSEQELRAALDETRTRGYAIDAELNTVGVTCFSRALPRGTGAPHAVSVTLLTARATPELCEALVADLEALIHRLPVPIGANP
jgi:DNA-binding IclR family transcriptional regulator